MIDEHKISIPKENILKDDYEKYSDDELWILVSKNDLEVLSHLYKQHYNSLYHYGLKCTNTPQLVEDSIQDLFLKLWDKRATIIIKKSIKAYVFMMFRRIVTDKLNQLTKREVIKQEQELVSPALSVQDLIISNELEKEKIAKLDKAINGLAPRQREIIYLRFYEDMSYEQIAETLHIKYQSVRNSVHEAIKQLKSTLVFVAMAIAMVL